MCQTEAKAKMTNPDHKDKLIALKRIEGQLRGIQKMIEEGQYCVDILHQMHAAMRAMAVVEDRVLETHFSHCVKNAFKSRSSSEKDQKISEILDLIRQFRKL